MRKIATRSCKKHHKHNFHWNGSSVNVLLSWYRFCNVKNICNYDIFFLLVRDLSFYLISPLSEQMNSCICSNSCSTVYHISYPSRNHAKASCLFVSYKLSATAISQMAGIGPRELSILPLFTQSVWMAECHVPIHSCVGTPPPPSIQQNNCGAVCLPKSNLSDMRATDHFELEQRSQRQVFLFQMQDLQDFHVFGWAVITRPITAHKDISLLPSALMLNLFRQH